jgi:hypothetical protein
MEARNVTDVQGQEIIGWKVSTPQWNTAAVPNLPD